MHAERGSAKRDAEGCPKKLRAPSSLAGHAVRVFEAAQNIPLLASATGMGLAILALDFYGLLPLIVIQTDRARSIGVHFDTGKRGSGVFNFPKRLSHSLVPYTRGPARLPDAF